MFNFDEAFAKADQIQQDTFGVQVQIDGGEPFQAIFNEVGDEFEGVGDVYRTLEVPFSDLPSGIENDTSQVYLIDDGRTFTIHKDMRVDNQVTLELR